MALRIRGKKEMGVPGKAQLMGQMKAAIAVGVEDAAAGVQLEAQAEGRHEIFLIVLDIGGDHRRDIIVKIMYETPGPAGRDRRVCP